MDSNANRSATNDLKNTALLQSDEDCRSTSSDEFDEDIFVERHLTVAHVKFSIIPNGGTGDCLFKAISQAIFEGDESEHLPIRQQVVAFIAEKTWEKYQVSVQVQHINGHSDLQKSWDANPVEAYKTYMLDAGTLGSFLELNAAGELYQFNFASIQEYNDSLGATYRVENSRQFPNKPVPMHYFLFTGDFDNGHWEFLKNLEESEALMDGTYTGSLDIVIENQVSSVEFWLMENTQIGKPEYEDITHSSYLRKKSKYPFDCPLLRFEMDKTVELIDVSFVITPSKYSDLFSVLANSHLRNESLAKDMHDLLTTYRNSNFSSLNYKLITQPHSHGFTTEVLKYASQAYKGNIQDLLSAADLYGFSFTLYLILGNVIHSCKFIHVDRWGGEVNTMEYFFLNIIPSALGNRQKNRAHWYHLVPVKGLKSISQEKPKKPTPAVPPSSYDIDCEQLAASINIENKKYIKNKAKDLYNLYFDRQLHPLSDDGDFSVKPSHKEPKANHRQVLSGKRMEATPIEENHSIEMQPNVFYKYGSLDPKLQTGKGQSEYPNGKDCSKSFHSIGKTSSQDLRMTPSNILYSRQSFKFNKVEKKGSKHTANINPEANKSSTPVGDSHLEVDNKRSKETEKVDSKVAPPSTSIGQSPTYNIILENMIKSASASTASSVKSILSPNLSMNGKDSNKNSEEDSSVKNFPREENQLKIQSKESNHSGRSEPGVSRKNSINRRIPGKTRKSEYGKASKQTTLVEQEIKNPKSEIISPCSRQSMKGVAINGCGSSPGSKLTTEMIKSKLCMNKLSKQDTPKTVVLLQRSYSEDSLDINKNHSSPNTKVEPQDQDPLDECGNTTKDPGDMYSRFYQRQFLLRKSDVELLTDRLQHKDQYPKRSLSDRISRCSHSRRRQVQPTEVRYSFSEKNTVRPVEPFRTIDTSVNTDGENLAAKFDTKPNFSLTSVPSAPEKPFIRKVIQERLRRESINDKNESLQTLRPNSDVSCTDVLDRDESIRSHKRGCLERFCNTIMCKNSK